MSIESDLVERAMRLSSGDRAELARKLILSLEDADAAADIDPAWEEEIERRLSAVERGEVNPVDWRDAVDRPRAELQNKNVDQ